jgi:hypothetical protein
MRLDVARLTARVQNLDENIEREDWIGAARALGDIAEIFPDIGSDVAIRAVQNGATVKSVADALGVPVSTLRGIRQEAGVA